MPYERARLRLKAAAGLFCLMKTKNKNMKNKPDGKKTKLNFKDKSFISKIVGTPPPGSEGKTAKVKKDSRSAVVHFQGKALDHINKIQEQYYLRFHEVISMEKATNLLIGKFPDAAVDQFIKLILDETTTEN